MTNTRCPWTSTFFTPGTRPAYAETRSVQLGQVIVGTVKIAVRAATATGVTAGDACGAAAPTRPTVAAGCAVGLTVARAAASGVSDGPGVLG